MGWDLIFAIISITMLSVLAFLAGRNLGRGVCKARPWLFLEAIAFPWFSAGFSPAACSGPTRFPVAAWSTGRTGCPSFWPFQPDWRSARQACMDFVGP